MASDNGGANFLVGFFVGAAMGVMGALLLAPKSGRELREELADPAGAAPLQGSTLSVTLPSSTTMLGAPLPPFQFVGSGATGTATSNSMVLPLKRVTKKSCIANICAARLNSVLSCYLSAASCDR